MGEQYPEWLTKDFIQRAIRSGGNRDLKVTSIQVKYATSPGDNYLSDMFRVNAITSVGETSLVVKAAKTVEQNTKTIFEKEIQMFTKVIPKVNNLLNENCHPITAQYLYSEFGLPTCAIVMEDLKPQGFKMADRTKGLDLDHCLLVMRSIARYHAATAVIFHETPQEFEELYPSNQSEDDGKGHFLINNIMAVAEVVEQWPEFGIETADKLRSLAKTCLTTFRNLLAFKKGGFNVINHGDLWVNNMMFRYEGDEVLEVRFVDFQMSRITSPGIDLQYFFCTSVSVDLFDKIDVLAAEYYKTLGEVFRSLDHAHLHPTWEKFETDLERESLYGVLCACSVLPIMLVDKQNAPDLITLDKDKGQVHISQLYKTTLRKLLPKFKERNWL